MRLNRSCVFAGVLAGGLGLAAAQACTDLDCAYPPGTPNNICPKVTAQSGDAEGVDLVLAFLQTAPVPQGHACAIAVSQIIGFETVGVSIVGRGETAPEIGRAYGFAPNPAPVDTLGTVARFRDGFFGRLSKDVDGGQPVAMRIHLRPTGSSGPLEAARAAEGAVVAFGAAHADGRFSAEHVTIVTVHNEPEPAK